MNLKKYRTVLEVLSVSIIMYLGHKLFFVLKESNSGPIDFYYSLEIIYGFFSVCSLLILFILIQVKEKNIDNVGYAFLWLTCIKMAISYSILSPILNSTHQNKEIEKINFFIAFALFLAIETVATIRLLNKKQ